MSVHIYSANMSIPQCTLQVPSVTFHSNSKSNYQFSNFYIIELMLPVCTASVSD